MGIKAALLNEQGLFLRVDDLADVSKLTDLHLPSITSCDLPPMKYKWIADDSNEYGGAFWPLDWLQKRGAA